MEQLTIHWTNTPEKNLEFTQKVDFVALSNGSSLLYIHRVSDSHFPREFKGLLQGLNINPVGLDVWVGKISKGNNKQVDLLQMKALADLLVHLHRPMFNIPVRGVPFILEDMVLRNHGFERLFPWIKLEEGIVFRRGFQKSRSQSIGIMRSAS